MGWRPATRLSKVCFPEGGGSSRRSKSSPLAMAPPESLLVGKRAGSCTLYLCLVAWPCPTAAIAPGVAVHRFARFRSLTVMAAAIAPGSLSVSGGPCLLACSARRRASQSALGPVPELRQAGPAGQRHDVVGRTDGRSTVWVRPGKPRECVSAGAASSWNRCGSRSAFDGISRSGRERVVGQRPHLTYITGILARGLAASMMTTTTTAAPTDAASRQQGQPGWPRYPHPQPPLAIVLKRRMTGFGRQRRSIIGLCAGLLCLRGPSAKL
jgi:hypothetical protein